MSVMSVTFKSSVYYELSFNVCKIVLASLKLYVNSIKYCYKLVLLSLELHKYMYYYFIPTPVDIVNGIQVICIVLMRLVSY